MNRRKGDSDQKAALREAVTQFMIDYDAKPENGADVNSIMRDMISVVLEGALDVEMKEELGYSKYDYKKQAGQKQP